MFYGRRMLIIQGLLDEIRLQISNRREQGK